MSVTDQLNESLNGHNNNEPRLVLDLELSEAQALRAWLLETEVNGLSAQDTPIVSAALSKLGRAVDTAQATINIRREFQQAGVNLAHWSDEQVLELGRRIAEAARPILQS
jgi:DNA polymerase III alpha subunit (gram-positive type)